MAGRRLWDKYQPLMLRQLRPKRKGKSGARRSLRGTTTQPRPGQRRRCRRRPGAQREVTKACTWYVLFYVRVKCTRPYSVIGFARSSATSLHRTPPVRKPAPPRVLPAYTHRRHHHRRRHPTLSPAHPAPAAATSFPCAAGYLSTAPVSGGMTTRSAVAPAPHRTAHDRTRGGPADDARSSLPKPPRRSASCPRLAGHTRTGSTPTTCRHPTTALRLLAAAPPGRNRLPCCPRSSRSPRCGLI